MPASGLATFYGIRLWAKMVKQYAAAEKALKKRDYSNAVEDL